jgi:hypothetical protein
MHSSRGRDDRLDISDLDGLKKGSNIENGRFTATGGGGLPSFGAILARFAKRKGLHTDAGRNDSVNAYQRLLSALWSCLAFSCASAVATGHGAAEHSIRRPQSKALKQSSIVHVAQWRSPLRKGFAG